MMILVVSKKQEFLCCILDKNVIEQSLLELLGLQKQKIGLYIVLQTIPSCMGDFQLNRLLVHVF